MKIKYHSWLKAKVGCAGEEVTTPGGVRTIGDLSAYLAERHKQAAGLFNSPQALRYVVDRRYVEPGHELAGSPTVEIYPPVTGG